MGICCSLQDVWDSLQADLVQLQQRVDAASSQWSVFTESQQQLDKWLLEVTTWLQSDNEELNTLPDKRSHLQNSKVCHNVVAIIDVFLANSLAKEF